MIGDTMAQTTVTRLSIACDNPLSYYGGETGNKFDRHVQTSSLW